MTDRPAPASSTDVLLGLVLDELQGLRADMSVARGGAVSASDEQGTVELREPTEPSSSTVKPPAPAPATRSRGGSGRQRSRKT